MKSADPFGVHFLASYRSLERANRSASTNLSRRAGPNEAFIPARFSDRTFSLGIADFHGTGRWQRIDLVDVPRRNGRLFGSLEFFQRRDGCEAHQFIDCDLPDSLAGRTDFFGLECHRRNRSSDRRRFDSWLFAPRNVRLDTRPSRMATRLRSKNRRALLIISF
jgi:hypothetical protein